MLKNVLCNRNTNINFDEALAEGQITLACTRRGDLGVTAHKSIWSILYITYATFCIK